MKRIKILLADDQTLMRDGLKTILDLEEDMEVIGVAVNGLQAYEMTGTLNPSVVLMDIRMPVMDGVESTRLIKKHYPDTVVIMLTTFDDEDYIIQALANGAAGYLLKDIPGDKLIESIRDGISGSLMIPAQVASKLALRLSALTNPIKKTKNRKLSDFSEREIDLITLIVKGMNNKQIASALRISEGTTKNYISVIYSKIGTSDRAKAVILLKEILSDKVDEDTY